MSFLMSLYVAVLFFVLVPGVLVTLPPGGKKLTAALVHSVVFALVYQLTHKAVDRLLAPYEPFENHTLKAKGVMCKAPADCQSNTCTNGMCA
jgi:hypothetical protein